MSAKSANKNGTDRTFAEASKHIQVIIIMVAMIRGLSCVKIIENTNCQNVTMSLTLGVIAKTP